MTNRPALALYGTSQDCVSLIPRQISDAGVNRWYESFFSCDSHLLICQRSAAIRLTCVLRFVGGEFKHHLPKRQAVPLDSFLLLPLKPLPSKPLRLVLRICVPTTLSAQLAPISLAFTSPIVGHGCDGRNRRPNLHLRFFFLWLVRKKHSLRLQTTDCFTHRGP
jgi:hypothetical protein